eukprot:gene2438-8762_t
MSKRSADDADLAVTAAAKVAKTEENGVEVSLRFVNGLLRVQLRAILHASPSLSSSHNCCMTCGSYTKLVYKEDPLPLQEHYTAGKQNQFVEVLIAPEFMTKDNRRVKARLVWGDTIYTPDSDVVAALMHMGFCAQNLPHPPASVQLFQVLLRLLPPLEKYSSKARFVKSRAWLCSADDAGCSFSIERCRITIRGTGAHVELEPCADESSSPYPTVQPGPSERGITTRTAGAKGKTSQEVSVQYSFCNEPWLKYTMSAIADKGLKRSMWTSSRLHFDVLLLETHKERFQICLTHTQGEDSGQPKDLFTLAKCKVPMPLGMMKRKGVPLPQDAITVLERDVAWEDFKWGALSLHVRGRELQLKRMHFIPISKPDAS